LTLVFSTKPTIDRAVSKAIEDQSKEIFKVAGSTHGFIVGEIRAFAFDGEDFEGIAYRQVVDNLRKEGWVECGGQAMPQRLYPDLYSRVGGRWGRFDNETARFPDLKGVFLRGWNHQSATSDINGDPDVQARKPSVLGQDKDRVGSSQPGALQIHHHKERATSPGYQGAGSSPQMIGQNATDPSSVFTEPPEGNSVVTSDFESRPKNKYVLYCIYTGVRL
jgi:hypothetical protein